MKNLLFLFLFGLSFNGFSQENYHKRFTVNDGLLSSDNYMTYQDKAGFMWICSPKGLVKYDGVNFKSFTVKNGLPINDIWYIKQDAQDRLWIGGFFKGLYYFQNDSIIGVSQKIDQSGLLFTSENEKGDSLFFTSIVDGRGYVFSNNKLESYKNDIGGTIIKPNIEYLSIETSIKNNKNVYTAFFNDIEVSDNAVKKRWIDLLKRFDQQYVLGKKYLIFNEKESTAVNPTEYFSGELTNILTITPTREVMVEVNDSIKVYKDLFTKERNFELENKLKPFIGKNISWITLDSENNIWLTLFRGNIIFIPCNNQFVNRYYPPDKTESNIINIEQSRNTMFLHAFDGGLFKFDLNKRTINSIVHRDILNRDDRIRNIFIYKDELVFVESYSLSILKDRTYFQYKNDSISINPSEIEFIDDYTFINPDFEIFKLHSTGTYTLVDEKNRIEARTHLVSSNNEYFISAGVEGIYLLDRKDNSIKNFPIVDIQCLKIIDDNILLGTNGGGLVLMDFDGEILKTTHPGLSITDIEIKNDYIFLASNKGILITKNADNSFEIIKSITYSDGLTSNDVNDIMVNDSLIYAGTVNGFNIINYKEILKKQTASPKIYLNNFTVNQKSQSIKENALDWNENTITYNFTGISFHSMGEMNYKYRLLGLTEKWLASQKNEITFWSLPAGNYTFEAVAINSYGVNSEQNIKHSFTIKDHFTETVVFKAIIVFGSLLMLGLILSYFQRRKVKRLEIEKRFAEIEMQALQSQMNPHFIFNALNSLQSVLFLRGENESNKFIGTFSKMIRATLDNSKKSRITLDKEIEYLNVYVELENRRLNNELIYSLTIDKKLDAESIEIPSMLFQPLVENAIIHGLIPKSDNKKLEVKFYVQQNFLVGEVIDNGIGREKAFTNKKDKEYKSWASTILNEKIQILNKLNEDKITFEIIDLYKNEIAVGTKIIIKLPLKHGN